MKISEIKALLATENITPDTMQELQQDERKGVQKLLQQHAKRAAQRAETKLNFAKRFTIEQSLWDKYPHIAGVDEVGRGPLAGPVVSAAVILDADFDVLGVNDSKQLTDAKRRQLFPLILEHAVAVGIGVQSEAVIDQINIYEATRVAMKQAVLNLDVPADYLLVDAMQIDLPLPQTKLIKGDAKSNSIAAASIVAKVIRDQLMETYDRVYPGYGFAKNAGYGTKEHLEGLKKLGVTPIHRQTFQPIPNFLK